MNHGEALRLYDEHGRALLAYACALLRDPSAAEDVLHQVFLNMLRRRGEIPGEPRPYLFRAVRNTALNHIRGRSREVELPGDGVGGVWLESPDASTETSLALQSALRILPEEQREVVVLHIWGGLTFLEAAAWTMVAVAIAAAIVVAVRLDRPAKAPSKDAAERVTIGQLTTLAIEQPDEFDAALTQISRTSLPDVREPGGALQMLAVIR